MVTKYGPSEADLNYNVAEIHKSEVIIHWGVPTTLNDKQNFRTIRENQITVSTFLLLEDEHHVGTRYTKNTASVTQYQGSCQEWQFQGG